MSALTPNQKRFVDEYLKDLNATRAYKAAYPNIKDEKVASAAASRLMKGKKVKKAIEERIQNRLERTEITQDQVLNELADIAFANITDFVRIEEQEVIVKSTDEIPKNLLPAIESIKYGKYGIEVKFHDKVRSLELLGRHLGMFNDKIEIKGTVNNPMEGLTTEELKKLIADD